MAFIVAVTVVTEVGDFGRFASPRQLTPSERSSGATVRRGGITKAGSSLARRALVEGAWSYRMQARVSRKLTGAAPVARAGQTASRCRPKRSGHPWERSDTSPYAPRDGRAALLAHARLVVMHGQT